MANNSLINEEQFNTSIQQLYAQKIFPYLNGATHTGCVPLGTVLPYYGETAPEHFLICDGTEYLKSDYGELATHLLSLTDPTPYQGSDSDHFKVPDLRGEFLRGAGTNSHTGNGDGSNVGVHQDGTQQYNLRQFSDKVYFYWNPQNVAAENADIEFSNGTKTAILNSSSSSYVGSPNLFIARPTNTSVTYIIAYQNAYIDLALDGFPIDITQPQDGQLLMYDATAGRWVNGGHKYSTNEHVVGTWIDGSKVYEKTVYLNSRVDVKNDWSAVVYTDSNINKLIDSKFYDTNGLSANKLIIDLPIMCDSSGNIRCFWQANNAFKIDGFTIRYTKTSD